MKRTDLTMDVQAEDLEVMLEGRLSKANCRLAEAFRQNERLFNRLTEARDQIVSLKEEVDKLCAPPSTYGVYLSVNEDGRSTCCPRAARSRSTCTRRSSRRGSSPARSWW